MSGYLSLSKRIRVIELVGDVDKGLSEDLAAVLEVDPLAAAIDGLTHEMRRMWWSILAITIVAMSLNAGMVGVGLSMGMGDRTMAITPATSSAPDAAPAMTPYAPDVFPEESEG